MATAGAMLPLAAASAEAATTTAAAGADAVAPGAPGTMSYFDLARKDCVGTAPGTASKVWYTVAGGVLSDTYEPTIDNTNLSTLQYIVTDGSTFTDLQTRDMRYTVSADPTGMACTVTATDAQHGYRLTTTYITDPASDTVLMHTRLSALPGSGTKVAGLHLYARLDAHPDRHDRAPGGPVRHAGIGLGLQCRADRAGRVQPRSGPGVHAARRGLLVRRLPPGGTSPICAVDPGTVPKAMDVITPADVSQATELDPTAGPVVIQPVTVP